VERGFQIKKAKITFSNKIAQFVKTLVMSGQAALD
jgi:hypothetical protein